MEDVCQDSAAVGTPSFRSVAASTEVGSGDSLLPLSFAQARLWFLDQLEPNSFFYNVPLRIGLDGPLRVDILAQALTSVVERHEVLRTTYECMDKGPVQKVNPSRAVELPLEHLTGCPRTGARL
jgi:hypothetical protein